MIEKFCQPGKASFIVGGQWGSEAKGCAAAWVADQLAAKGRKFDIVTTNAGAQAGHTSHYKGTKRVVFHLPTAPLITGQATGCRAARGTMYLNAGSIIDPEGLRRELEENNIESTNFFIHPMAAIIRPEDKEAEQAPNSRQTQIASTRKGVGQALASKVLRSGMTAKDHPYLKQFVRRMNLNAHMNAGKSVLVEVPQGIGLSLNGKFYPHCTSRDCTPSSALSDAQIHPHFYNQTLMVIRTFPIRVGNIEHAGGSYSSGSHYPDQRETSWGELGVEAEITTVTKRVRRVFTFSQSQLLDACGVARPDIVMVMFCNYAKTPALIRSIREGIHTAARVHGFVAPLIFYQYGPEVENVTASLDQVTNAR